MRQQQFFNEKREKQQQQQRKKKSIFWEKEKDKKETKKGLKLWETHEWREILSGTRLLAMTRTRLVNPSNCLKIMDQQKPKDMSMLVGHKIEVNYSHLNLKGWVPHQNLICILA